MKELFQEKSRSEETSKRTTDTVCTAKRTIPSAKGCTDFHSSAIAAKKRKYCCKQYKFFYEPSIAQENYEIILRDSRIGLDITLEDKATFDTILKEGISKGQSIHHIVEANKDKLRYSERSAYRLVDRSQTLVQALDLRHKVKLKPRKHYAYKEDNKKVRKGRTYADYIAFLAKNPLIHPYK